MTTTVTVKANHGWPVDVTAINGDNESTTRVPAGETKDFIVFDGQDLRVHEVQPRELDAENQGDDLPLDDGQEPA